MPPSSSLPNAPKSTMPTAVATSVKTKLTVGVAIGFIAGILGGSYGFALLSNRIAPAPAPSRPAAVAPAADQCQTGCADTYNFTKGGPTYDADVQLCVKTCREFVAIGGNVPGLAPSNPQTGTPTVPGGTNVPGLAPGYPETPNPVLGHKCADGTVLAMGVPCPQGGSAPSQPALCPDGSPNTSIDGKCYCPGTTIVMNATTICPVPPSCRDLCATKLNTCLQTGSGKTPAQCQAESTTCVNACAPPPSETAPCTDPTMTKGSDGKCHPTVTKTCIELCTANLKSCKGTSAVCNKDFEVCASRCNKVPVEQLPCLNLCVTKTQTCPLNVAGCASSMTLCTDSCLPVQPTCPAGYTFLNGTCSPTKPATPDCKTSCMTAYTNCPQTTSVQKATCSAALTACNNACPQTGTTGGTNPAAGTPTCLPTQRLVNGVCI